MKYQLGEKAIACLRIAAMQFGDRRAAALDAVAARYGWKVVGKIFESLEARRYIDCGVSPRMGWLTSKGVEALKESGGSES